jgi:hypothetical protein
MAPKKLTIIQGKTFSDIIRLSKKPIVYKAITGISLATGAPRLTVPGHGIAEEWPVAITRVVGPKEINAKSVPPDDDDYVAATFINSSTIELNTVCPVDDRGKEWSAYESGGFIQYRTPVDLSSVKVRVVFRKSFSIRLNLKCTTGGTSGSAIPAAAGADGTVTWEETTEPATVAWAPNTVFVQNDVVDAKALVWLSTDGGEVVADNANKKITTTILATVTAKMAKQNLVYEVEIEEISGVVRLVESGTAVVELEGTP